MDQTPKLGSHFHQELKILQDSILRLGGMVEKNIYQAVEALKERNTSLAESVIARDRDVDELEIEVEDRCIRLIALHQPVAKDLRVVTTGISITHELERMGDIAVNIAERTLELCEEPQLKPLIDIPRMAAHAHQMLRRSLDAYVREDVPLALEVCDSDDLLDQLNEQVFRELISFMIENPRTIGVATRLILVGRYLERFGDHATNIGEMVVFMVEGRNIRHARKLGRVK
ncbi:MAG: phosphate signaling complex protein PhoU [bacterium]